ncbi:MAG: type IV pilus assembly protein PilF [Methylophagaceae bacterium]|jgi:type IV pilus assembly protein PilF
MKKNSLAFILPFLVLLGCQGPTSSVNTRTDSKATVYTKQDKKAAKLNMQLGVNYMQRGDYATALGKLEKALKQDPNLASGHNTIAILYQRLSEFDKAEYHFQRAVSLEPTYSEAHNNYGAYLCGQGRYEESVSHFLAAVKNPLYSSAGQAYENAGLCANRIPDFLLAEQYLRKALQIDPRLGKSLLAMAQMSFQQGDYLVSRAYLKRYRNAARWTPQALLQAIKTEQKIGDKNAVSSYSLLLRGRFPDSEESKQVQSGQL